MGARITLDQAGRIVIPKPVRDRLRLAPGDAFELEDGGEEIVLRPVRDLAPLSKEQGVWVYRTGLPLTALDTNAVLREVRSEREAENFERK